MVHERREDTEGIDNTERIGSERRKSKIEISGDSGGGKGDRGETRKDI